MTVDTSTDQTSAAAQPAKRARFLAATGLPAVLVAGGVIIPALANASSAAAAGACPAGSTPSPVKQAAPAAPVQPTGSGGTSAHSSAPAPIPGATTQQKAAVPAGGATTPAVPQPTGTATSPSSVPTSTPATHPSSSKPAPSPSSSPSGGPTWWDPFTWFNTTTPSAQVFNPKPMANAGVRNASVNKLITAQVPNPAVVAAMNATSAPSTPATPPPTTPSTPAPTTPSATGTGPVTAPASSPAGTPSASGSATQPGSTPSSPAATSVCVKSMGLNAPNESLWHLKATTLTLNGMTYNGVVTIKTANGPVNVMDFTADSIDLDSMVTYSTNPVTGKNDYANGGKGQTVHLTDVHLHVLKQFGWLGPLPVTLEPGNIPTELLGLLATGVKVPIPVTFLGVTVDQYLLTAKTLTIPGFNTYQD